LLVRCFRGARHFVIPGPLPACSATEPGIRSKGSEVGWGEERTPTRPLKAISELDWDPCVGVPAMLGFAKSAHPDLRKLLRFPDSRFPIPDSRFPIPDSRFPIPDFDEPCNE